MSSPSASGWTLQPAMTSRRWRVPLVWWITCVIWSSIFLFIKIGVTEVPPLGFATSRLALAAVALLLFTRINVIDVTSGT